MKLLCIAVLVFFTFSCTQPHQEPNLNTPAPIEGTWQLISGTLIENGDTTVTDYTKHISFIKIINGTHFAFLGHDLNHGRDSLASYTSGGGVYTIRDSLYTEYLQFSGDRQWEDHDFQFVVTIKDDTLTQQGIEKVEEAGVDRMNIERYVRIRP